jgi:hypothetical protein
MSRAVTAFALARIAYGAGLIVAPRRVAAGWLPDDAGRSGTQVAVRGLGVRDAALAAGVVLAVRSGASPRIPLAVCAACDVADIAATLAAGSALPRRSRLGTVGLAGATAVLGAALAAGS